MISLRHLLTAVSRVCQVSDTQTYRLTISAGDPSNNVLRVPNCSRPEKDNLCLVQIEKSTGAVLECLKKSKVLDKKSIFVKNQSG